MASFLVVAQVVLTILGVLTALAAITTARTPQGAVAWVVFLVSHPLLALPAFAMFGRIGFQGYERQRRISDRAIEHAAPDAPGAEPTRIEALEAIAARPVTRGNRAEILIDGEATFDALFEAMDAARRELLVQFYIVRDDAVGRALHARMTAAARRGVSVRFLYDALGSFRLGRAYVRELREAGVAVHPIHGPRRPVGRVGINFRNHRKTVIADARVGFTGGINAGQEYIDGGAQFDAWRDTFVRLRGPMVTQLRTVFAQDWSWAAQEPLEDAPREGCADAPPDPDAPDARAAPGGVPGLILACGPTDAIERGSLFLCGLIGLARERLWIATPYFVPHTDLLTAIQLAAMRGVSVRILVPAEADHLLPWYASRDYFDAVQAVGAEMWEYEAGFMHQKVMLVDDDIASIGTVNLDIRSVMLNFEETAVIEDGGFAGKVEAMLEADFARARLAPPNHQSRRVRLLAPVARLFGPLL